MPTLELDPVAQDAFVRALADAFPAAPTENDPGLDHGLAMTNTIAGRQVLENLANQLMTGPEDAPAPPSDAGTASGAETGFAAGFDVIGAIKNAALALANLTTYWTMKERAGTVGRLGLAPTLDKIFAAAPAIHVHFIGHSFGGRLVTSAANELAGGPAGPSAATMLLLQAAYSHFGLAKTYQAGLDGFFRGIITSNKIRSEIQVTHSSHDIAVGLAYPLASAIARQVGSAVFVNPFGGMGGDGAHSTPESFEDALQPVGATYTPVTVPNIVRNLNGDALIMSHGDVTHDEIGYAFLRAVRASSS